jgi:AraC-like DNA-binding protein
MGAEKRRELRLPSQLVRPALALVAERGGDVRELVRRHALPEDADTEREIVVDLESLRAFLDEVARSLDEPHLGSVVARRTERGTWDLLEHSCRSAPDVRGALRRMSRYVRLANDIVQIRFLEGTDRAASIEQTLPGSPLVIDRHGNEFFVATVVLKCRELSGKQLTPTRVEYAHGAPESLEFLHELLGTRNVAFGCGKNAVVFDAESLDSKLIGFDPSLLSILDRYAEQALESRGDRSAFLVSVRDSIREQLVEGKAVLAETARTMGVTQRTLQRRLTEEGTSFGAEMESVREELARVYVSDRTRPLMEVAFLLGYSDLSTFVRAFRRWTGVTPARFRLTSDTRK